MDDREFRLESVRRYLLDVAAYSGGLIEASDAISYVQWNFQRALLASLEHHDRGRAIKRLAKTPAELPEGVEAVQVSGEMTELALHAVEKVAGTPESFALWFHRAFVAPLVAEENRVLRYSSSPTIWALRPARGFMDRFADHFRFQAWEQVYFPDAKSVPPRVEPCPSE